MVASLVSLYYYLNVIREWYISPSVEGDVGVIEIPNHLYGLVCILVIFVILIGVYPDPVVNIIEHATAAILPAGEIATFNLR